MTLRGRANGPIISWTNILILFEIEYCSCVGLEIELCARYWLGGFRDRVFVPAWVYSKIGRYSQVDNRVIPDAAPQVS
jgi:hypothetical protein